MEILNVDTFIYLAQKMDLATLQKCYDNIPQYQVFLAIPEVLESLRRFHRLYVQVTSFCDLTAAYRNKYEPLTSTLSWEELKKIIVETSDVEAFRINYLSFKEPEDSRRVLYRVSQEHSHTLSRERWFPECVHPPFLEVLGAIDPYHYEVCMGGVDGEAISSESIAYQAYLYPPEEMIEAFKVKLDLGPLDGDDLDLSSCYLEGLLSSYHLGLRTRKDLTVEEVEVRRKEVSELVERYLKGWRFGVMEEWMLADGWEGGWEGDGWNGDGWEGVGWE